MNRGTPLISCWGIGFKGFNRKRNKIITQITALFSIEGVKKPESVCM